SFLSFISSSESWSGVIARASPAFIPLLRDALYEARLDRQLGGRKPKRLLGELDRHAIELEQDAAGLHAGDPQLDAALARAHAHFERLLGDRHVREHPDPHPAGALHVTGERTPRRLDLARGHALGLQRLEPVLAEGERLAAGRLAADAAFVRLAELGFDRLQHDWLSLGPDALGRVAARPAGLALGHFLVLRHRVVLHDLALEDPDLDAAGTVGGERGGDAEVDVGAQRMQRHAAFAIPLHARDLGAAETARAIDADAFRAEPHRRLHGALHRAAERNT